MLYIRHVATKCLLAATNLFDKFLLTSFATAVMYPRISHQVGYKPKKIFLLAPIAALFCTVQYPPILTMVAQHDCNG